MSKKDLGVITEISGIGQLRLCNNFKYGGNGDEPSVESEDDYKFAEVKFLDKDGVENVLEFKHIPGDGLWHIRHNGKKIGDAITWPVSYSENDIPLAAAAFCSMMFGYDFTVAKDLRKFGARVGHAFATGLEKISDMTAKAHYDVYKQQKIDKYKKDMNT